MRLRNIRGSKEIIAESKYCVQNYQEHKGNWSALFGNQNPIHIEVGMGKGQFLTRMALLHPEINYLGIEMYDSVLLRAVQRRERLEEDPTNLFFIRMDAKTLEETFAPGEIDRIYLNFSDPWPKDRHAKRRLTSREFLARYEKVLKPGGLIEFKTDNQDLFTFSLEENALTDSWTLLASTRDLHHDEALNQGNVMTEYEEKFSSQGNPICKMIVRYDPA